MAESSPLPPSQNLVLQTGWLSLAETVEKIGKSASTIERWVASGMLPSKLERRPGRKPERLYDAEAVARLAAQTERPDGTNRSLIVAPARPHAPAEVAVADKSIAAFGEVMKQWVGAQRLPPLAEKFWLTLDEAALLSGIPRTSLKKLIGANEIRARRFGRAWRIRRDHLQAFGE